MKGVKAAQTKPAPFTPNDQPFKIGIERSRDVFLKAGFERSEYQQAEYAEGQEMLRKIIDRHYQNCRDADADITLSETGKAQKFSQSSEEAERAIDLFRESKISDNEQQRLENEMLGRMKQSRDRNRHSNEIVRYLQVSNMERYLYEIDREGRQAHKDKIQHAEQIGIPLSDEEREYRTQIHDITIEAIDQYGPENEVVLAAVLDSPTMISAITKADKERYHDMLSRKISPELAKQLDWLKVYKPALEVMAEGARRAVADPNEKHPRRLFNPALKPISEAV